MPGRPVPFTRHSIYRPIPEHLPFLPASRLRVPRTAHLDYKIIVLTRLAAERGVFDGFRDAEGDLNSRQGAARAVWGLHPTQAQIVNHLTERLGYAPRRSITISVLIVVEGIKRGQRVSIKVKQRHIIPLVTLSDLPSRTLDRNPLGFPIEEALSSSIGYALNRAYQFV